MNKITEGSKWKMNGGNEVKVLYVHEEGIMYRYNSGLVMAKSYEDFLKIFTPIRETRKVFRLWKFLEDENHASELKAKLILSGWPLESEGKTEEEAKRLFYNKWLVEEEIK